MTKKQSKEIQKLEFCVGECDERGRISIESENIPSLLCLEKLISILTFDNEIHYWDAYRKSPTDPGGYVTAIRMDEETVAYMDGNHGWTSNWDIISIHEMAQRMQKNWDKDCDQGMYLNKVLISQNKYVTRERINRDKK